MLIKPQNGPPPGAATKGEDDDEGQETGLLLGEGKVDSLPPPPDGKLVRVDSKVIKAERDVAGSGRGKPVSAKGIFLLLLSKIAGCGHIVTTRLLLREALFEPAALAVLRNVVTILFLGSILLCKRDLRTNLGTICKEVFAFWRQVVVGALGTFALQTFVMQSLNLIPATNLAVLSQLSPPFLFVIAGFILKTETPSWTKFLGMMAAVGGAVLIIDPTHFKASDVGNLMCVGMALAYAIIVTVQKHVVRAIPAAALQFTFTAYAIPFFVLLAAGLGQIRGIRLTPYSAGLATVVGVCASLDYYFAFASLKFVSTLLVGLANSFLPLFVGIVTYFVNGETLEWNDYLGAVLILGGMITVISQKDQQDRGGGMARRANRPKPTRSLSSRKCNPQSCIL